MTVNHPDPATLLSIRHTIRSCTSCSLHKSTTPVPWSGDPFPDIAILGEAPGRSEARDGEPFIGSAGQLLRTLLRQVGINDKKVAYLNAASCFPDRTPNQVEIEACRPNMRLQVALLQPRYLITVGKVAWHSVRGFARWPDLQLVHGKPFYWPNNPAPANPKLWHTYHPAAALRSGKYRRILTEDLEGFVAWRKREEAGDSWPTDCYLCGDGFYRHDDWGMAMCKRHASRQGSLFPEDVQAVMS